MELKLILEALLFSAQKPLSLKELRDVFAAAVEHGAGNAAYAASKAAAVALVDSLAEDLRGTAVRANSILPHLIDTEANRKAMPNPLRLAVIAQAHFDTVRLPFPPVWMQQVGLALGAPLGRLLGYGATYVPGAEHTETEAVPA